MIVSRKAQLPSGFKASAVAGGIKKSGKLDLALFYSEVPAKAACLFTANKIQAAPIKVSKKHLKSKQEFQAIIVNSGNANALTGSAGVSDAVKTAKVLSVALGIEREGVLLASTGIIGRRLEVAKIKNAVPALIDGLSPGGINKAKAAIMTTDTFAKEITVKVDIGGARVTICGIAKGAGMIAPDLGCSGHIRGATLLAFIFTDAGIAGSALKKALSKAAGGSFECISVDGCMSTNDSIMLMANAAAGNKEIKEGSGDFDVFCSALDKVCLELAKLIVRDAEGATKFIKISVAGAKSSLQAKKAALAIANSVLFKTAVYGENPNFGRVASAVGASGIDVREEGLKIKLGPLHRKDVEVKVHLGGGSHSAVVYTADLTPGYIKINAEYN